MKWQQHCGNYDNVPQQTSWQISNLMKVFAKDFHRTAAQSDEIYIKNFAWNAPAAGRQEGKPLVSGMRRGSESDADRHCGIIDCCASAAKNSSAADVFASNKFQGQPIASQSYADVLWNKFIQQRHSYSKTERFWDDKSQVWKYENCAKLKKKTCWDTGTSLMSYTVTTTLKAASKSKHMSKHTTACDNNW